MVNGEWVCDGKVECHHDFPPQVFKELTDYFWDGTFSKPITDEGFDDENVQPL
jgi:hypothetical protein